jgi:hypothetical protein
MDRSNWIDHADTRDIQGEIRFRPSIPSPEPANSSGVAYPAGTPAATFPLPLKRASALCATGVARLAESCYRDHAECGEGTLMAGGAAGRDK